jgi:hypothetical protein|tara:strand:- start:1356 stop:1604 length:249 start_codon:yes stop_codon:yes gene_type:complete
MKGQKHIMENPMKMRTIDLSLAIGDEILVGQNKDKAKITKIEFFEKSGEVVLGTTRGTRKALTFSIPQAREEEVMCPADKYR